MAESEERRFCRFATDRSVADGYRPLPPDGLCLSSFVILARPGVPRDVLLGRIDPAAPWGHIGGLDPRRIALNAAGWMLPSSHLLFYEAPADAARRVLDEQLGLRGISMAPVEVFSERGAPRRHPGRDDHWDLEFLYRAEAPAGWEPGHAAWSQLRFLDPSRTPRSEFTRSHDEVLELAGYAIG